MRFEFRYNIPDVSTLVCWIWNNNQFIMWVFTEQFILYD